jgi:hypothetical protein
MELRASRITRLAAPSTITQATEVIDEDRRGLAMTDDTRFAPVNGGLFPKIAPLPGSLHREWRRCGKANCRCSRGHLHGPYWVRRWWEPGRQRKAYVPRRQVDQVAAAISAWHRLHPPAWTMRQALADLRRREQETLR